MTFADVAFEATGKTIEEMFICAAKATTNSMVDDLTKIETKKSIKIEIKANDEEKLLFEFLQEIIFYKDAKQLLFREYEILIKKIESGFLLEANLKGEKINNKKHDLIVDVKAVSWHRFEVEKTKSGYRAFVILDV